MNRSLFLHVIERLEGLVGRLPTTIQKPILSELTPLKELFLKQRPPRFVFTGSPTTPLAQLMPALFPDFAPVPFGTSASRKDRWRDYVLSDRGTISILDARQEEIASVIGEELESRPADVIFFVDDEDRKKIRKDVLSNLATLIQLNRRSDFDAGVVGVIYDPAQSKQLSADDLRERGARLDSALRAALDPKTPLLRILAVRGSGESEGAQAVISAITRNLPNEARIETARVFGDKQTQAEIGQLLVKSTTAICTAIGAQPIPLADLPILTTLQLVMVSGIMYVSGRERSLRAAAEFVAALGANVGAGMLLREGARAILKLVPGWGNIVCGMVAGAGTYAIGRAAITYFLEGLSIKEARRTYLTSRRRAREQAQLTSPSEGNGAISENGTPARRRRLRG
jgi:uncharacterized protein (DUF697 family)